MTQPQSPHEALFYPMQLWALPHGPHSALCPNGVPRCVMLLAHQGQVTWDVQVGGYCSQKNNRAFVVH